jgi:RNA polymerase sigma-70 factor (ECF subfamily)
MSQDINAHNDFAHATDDGEVHLEISPVPESDADVIERYEDSVRRYCRSRTATPEDADDAVQDTFLRFLRRADHKIHNKEAWLITAAFRACADINRRRTRDEYRKASSSPFDGVLEEDGSNDVADVHAANPEAVTVEQLTIAALFRQMNPREATVLAHVYLMGATTEQVARYLGVSVDYLYVIVSRARRHARAILAAREESAPT